MEATYNYILIDVRRPLLIMNKIEELFDCVPRYIVYRNEQLVKTENYHLIWIRTQSFFRLCKWELER